MKQIRIIIGRLKNPAVLISIASQIVTVLLLFNIKVDMDIVTGIITAICSVLVLLGIVSDPNTQNKSFGDDLMECSQCHQISEHVPVNGKLVCKECGCENCFILDK